MSELKIWFLPESHDQVGKLCFEVVDRPFSGSGFFWSDLSEVPSLLEELGTFPLSKPIAKGWGYDQAAGEYAVLSLTFEPSGMTGGVSVSVVVADLYDLQRRVSAKFQIDYASLDRFMIELRVVIECREGEALLQGI